MLTAKVKRRGRLKCLEQPIFNGLVAYIQEKARRQVDGRWEMRLDPQDGETWTP